ncbi:Hypothetical predicted protein [Olea europaea subsp. europaea]|uniref:Uncharacterized protein n=2 Tax=Olea europaea subsp. europaea TaxID=158383 RepID=A0A8S0UK81_OLEEU|nr:Hypothetical predicted protein [Olea europaea subsp. europaea]
MKQEEKERKFHEALLKMLYPPPPSPPPQEEEEEEENKPIKSWREGVNVNQIPDDLEDEERSSSSSDHDGEDCNGAIQKLTRAQRKRLRRKKLKEESSQRRKIIGPMPLLSNANDGGNGGGGDVVRKALENVRQNASVETDTVMEKSGELASCSKQNKLKQRRMGKKLASEKLKSSGTETTSHQGEKEGLKD